LKGFLINVIMLFKNSHAPRGAGENTMLRGVGPTELIIVLIIVVLLFGVGRIGKVGRELGSAISEFRQGLQEGKEEEDEADPSKKEETTS
jgi:sec-independent protein translocase protein TatA